jgi:hypothetical protein
MNVDPARRHQMTGSIDLATTLTQHNADRGNRLSVNCYVCQASWSARAVNHRSSANDQIVYHD